MPAALYLAVWFPDRVFLLLLHGVGVRLTRDGRQPEEVRRIRARRAPRRNDRKIYRHGADAPDGGGFGVHPGGLPVSRSAERRGGKECVRPCRSGGWQFY